jgi:hypothetical protein
MTKKLPRRLSVVGAVLLLAVVSGCKTWECGSNLAHTKDYTYTTNNGAITITKYFGVGGAVIIPSTINDLPIASIGSKAFFECTNLTSIAIPDSVTNIGSNAFCDCTSLTSVTIGNGVISIGYAAFCRCNLTNVVIGDNVSNIGDFAFAHCSMANVTIPNSVTVIGNEAFYDCTNLISVIIPDSVTSIGVEAFDACTRLASVSIGNSVTNIGNTAFLECASLTGITVNADNSVYSSVDGALLNTNQAPLIQYPGGTIASYICPNPNRVPYFWCNAINSSDGGKSIDILNAFYSSVERQTTFIQYPGGKDGSYYVIPSGVTRVGGQAFFECTNLTSLTLPAGIVSIGDWAFALCNGLTSVYFQGNAPTVGSHAFDGTTNVIVYYLPGTTGWGPTFSGRPTMLWTNAPGH